MSHSPPPAAVATQNFYVSKKTPGHEILGSLEGSVSVPCSIDTAVHTRTLSWFKYLSFFALSICTQGCEVNVNVQETDYCYNHAQCCRTCECAQLQGVDGSRMKA